MKGLLLYLIACSCASPHAPTPPPPDGQEAEAEDAGESDVMDKEVSIGFGDAGVEINDPTPLELVALAIVLAAVLIGVHMWRKSRYKKNNP